MAIWKIPVSNDMNSFNWTLVTFKDNGQYQPSGNYDPQYKYRIEIDGSPYVFYTTLKLTEMLREIGITIGTAVYLGRLGEGTATNWQMQYVSGPVKDWSAEPLEPQQAQAPAAPASPPPPGPAIPSTPPPPPSASQAAAPPAPPPTNSQPPPPPAQPMYTQKDLGKVMLPFEDDEVLAWRLLNSQHVALLQASHENAKLAWPGLESDSEFVRTMAISAFIETNRSMKSPRGWKVGEYTPPPDPDTEDGRLALIAIEIDSIADNEAYVARLFVQFAEKHAEINHAKHAKSIAKILGYAGAKYGDMRQTDFWQGMARELWLYEDARAEGLERNDVLDLIHKQFGRPKNIMEYEVSEKEREDDEEPILI